MEVLHNIRNFEMKTNIKCVFRKILTQKAYMPHIFQTNVIRYQFQRFDNNL